MTVKDDFDTALCESDAPALEAILSLYPQFRELLKNEIDPKFFAENEECYKIIPVIARYYPQFVHARDENGMTALHHAAPEPDGNFLNVRALVNAGSDIHAVTKGGENVLTRLMKGIEKVLKKTDRDDRSEKFTKILQFLTQLGFSLNERAYDEHSLLQKALGRRYWWIDPLIDAGANVDAALGMTPGKPFQRQFVNASLDTLFRYYGPHDDKIKGLA